ncbi:IS3 family transposase [Serpentinicella alkaliphila]|uniref:IS3 family transposase n=1 Tax=Serpentinicella alkaliphila TaxID=1734049 RepID=UPI001BEF61C3|nr:IS3 family transposase [Serpentinicella alkaliphila]QUH27171.1 IS3 family transposase [Serpentinicella alkaliphila]
METSQKEDELNGEGKRRLNVSGVLKILGVSRSGYNSFKKRIPSDMNKRKEYIKVQIKQIHDESYQNYGAPKITQLLQQNGETISEKTVGNYMREMGIKAQYVKPYTITTIDSNFSEELTNILNKEFNPSEPNAVWYSDITYIWTYEGFVYLTSIMDLYSRKIISWVLSTTLEAKWVIEAINKAKASRNISKPLVMHSDRGVQYTCTAYQKSTEKFINSYSRKANPWDNACIESFHALIKREWINKFKILDYNHAYRLVFNYIEAFYNTVRIHSHCGYLSPNQYEAEYNKELSKLYQEAS